MGENVARDQYRPEKLAIQRELSEKLSQSDFVIFVDYMGLNVEQLTDVRSRLRAQEARFQVVPNKQLAHVVKSLGWTGDAQGWFQGPTAMVVGPGQIVEVSKALRSFSKETKLAPVKGGCWNGAALTSEDVSALADLPSREVLLSRFVGTLAAPMTQLAGVLNEKAASVVRVLKAFENKRNEQG